MILLSVLSKKQEKKQLKINTYLKQGSNMQKETKNLNSVIMEIAMQKGKKDKKFMNFDKKDKNSRRDKVKEMVKEQLTNPSNMLKEEFSYLDKALNESLADSLQKGASWLAAGLSFVPGLNLVGAGIEAANALTYALRGQYGNAAMSGAMAGLGLIPGVGGAGRIATAAAKAVAKPVAGAISRAARGASTAIDDVARAADAVADARKLTGEISAIRMPKETMTPFGLSTLPGKPSAELLAKRADAIAKAKAARDVIQTEVPILGKVPTVRGAIGQIQGKIARGAESVVPTLGAHERALAKSQYKLGPKRAAAAGAVGSGTLARGGLGTLGSIAALQAIQGGFGTSPGTGVVDPFASGGNLRQLSSDINVSLMPQMRQIALSAPAY